MPIAEEAGIQNGDMVRLGEKSKEEMASELNKLQSVTTPSGRKVRGVDGRKRVEKRQNDKEEIVHHRQYGRKLFLNLTLTPSSTTQFKQPLPMITVPNPKP